MTSRHKVIVHEVKVMAPDIICFQEVSYEHYEKQLNPDLARLGYCGILHQRMDDQGMAIFWKDASFELLQQKHCLLHHLAETHLQVMNA